MRLLGLALQCQGKLGSVPAGTLPRVVAGPVAVRQKRPVAGLQREQFPQRSDRRPARRSRRTSGARRSRACQARSATAGALQVRRSPASPQLVGRQRVESCPSPGMRGVRASPASSVGQLQAAGARPQQGPPAATSAPRTTSDRGARCRARRRRARRRRHAAWTARRTLLRIVGGLAAGALGVVDGAVVRPHWWSVARAPVVVAVGEARGG